MLQKLHSWASRWGPLLMWAACFAVSALVKAQIFSATDVWYSLPPDAALWAVGLLLADILSRQNSAGFEIDPDYLPQEGGVYVKANLTHTGDLRENPGRTSLAMVGMVLWIMALVLSEKGLKTREATNGENAGLVALATAYAIAFAVVSYSVAAAVPRKRSRSGTASTSSAGDATTVSEQQAAARTS